MANYYAYSRSSYFKVKDLEEYKDFCNKWDLTLISREDKEEGTLHGFIVETDDGMIPSYYYDEEIDDYIDDEEDLFLKELSEQLAPDWIAIYQEIGYEKLRYLVGYSVMVDSEGNFDSIGIDDIYELAHSKWGKKHTQCQY